MNSEAQAEVPVPGGPVEICTASRRGEIVETRTVAAGEVRALGTSIHAALVRSILEKWRHYDWSVQGFGFIRTKIADVGRIHVWDARLAVPLVSTAHTHPWEFRSTIISGELLNLRFGVVAAGSAPATPYLRSRIATGEGGGLRGEPEAILLSVLTSGYYTAGMFYHQCADDIHRTLAQDGTVTLLERQQGPPLEEAWTFWPRGTEWVSAEPRAPKGDWELSPIFDYALARWSAV